MRSAVFRMARRHKIDSFRLEKVSNIFPKRFYSRHVSPFCLEVFDALDFNDGLSDCLEIPPKTETSQVFYHFPVLTIRGKRFILKSRKTISFRADRYREIEVHFYMGGYDNERKRLYID